MSEAIACEGRVIKLERGYARVRLSNGHVALCHVSGKMRQAHISLMVDDRVEVEVSPPDYLRGRITYRHKS
jgi:translation initiation factor IF-1